MNLGEVVDRNAFSDEIFLIEVAPDGNTRNLTYSQLHRDADALARGLTKRGLKRGERIGILAGNSAEYRARTRSNQLQAAARHHRLHHRRFEDRTDARG